MHKSKLDIALHTSVVSYRLISLRLDFRRNFLLCIQPWDYISSYRTRCFTSSKGLSCRISELYPAWFYLSSQIALTGYFLLHTDTDQSNSFSDLCWATDDKKRYNRFFCGYFGILTLQDKHNIHVCTFLYMVLLVTVSSVLLQFMASDYPFGIF